MLVQERSLPLSGQVLRQLQVEKGGFLFLQPKRLHLKRSSNKACEGLAGPRLGIARGMGRAQLLLLPLPTSTCAQTAPSPPRPRADMSPVRAGSPACLLFCQRGPSYRCSRSDTASQDFSSQDASLERNSPRVLLTHTLAALPGSQGSGSARWPPATCGPSGGTAAESLGDQDSPTVSQPARVTQQIFVVRLLCARHGPGHRWPCPPGPLGPSLRSADGKVWQPGQPEAFQPCRPPGSLASVSPTGECGR